MFSLLKKKKKIEAYDSVIDGLKRLYRSKLLPLEEAYKFDEFHSPRLEDADFNAKPMIVLVGQYSTGKTTFIRYLLGQDYPGMRIGVEPTTDRFIAVMQSQIGDSAVIPGHALISDRSLPFFHLQRFGGAFLNRFQASVVTNDLLNNFTFIDTPGILSGDKQRENYNIFAVLDWFFERADRIILLFDAHKLDISDELRIVIEKMRNHDEKIRIVLNKADRVDAQQLMRVYGALMWSLGKVLATPEVTRVYVGSFWNEPRLFDDNRKLFELEEADLFYDLQSLPRSAALRKLNDLIKRARMVRIHAFIIGELKEAMPVMGKEKKQKELIAKLGQVYAKISREQHIPIGDMPDMQEMQEKLAKHDFSKFPSLQQKLIKAVDDLLSKDVAQLMLLLPKEEVEEVELTKKLNGEAVSVMMGENSGVFGVGSLEGFDAGRNEPNWIVDRFRKESDYSFAQLSIDDGKVPGSSAKRHMVQTKLPNAVLGRIWKLSDIDRDGYLDADEWALANYIIQLRLNGYELPDELPEHLVPPSKRHETMIAV